MLDKRPKREVSAHKRRHSLEDQQGVGKLNVDGMDDGYYYHVANDKNGRVQQLQDRGFEVVQHNGKVSMGDSNAKEAGTAVQTTANASDGSKAILMRIPKEFKEEDDAYRQSQIDKGEEALYRQAENEQGRYGTITKE